MTHPIRELVLHHLPRKFSKLARIAVTEYGKGLVVERTLPTLGILESKYAVCVIVLLIAVTLYLELRSA